MSRLRSDRLGLGISGRHLVLAAARRGSASPWWVARALADDAASPAGVAQLPGLLAELFDALAQQRAAGEGGERTAGLMSHAAGGGMGAGPGGAMGGGTGGGTGGGMGVGIGARSSGADGGRPAGMFNNRSPVDAVVSSDLARHWLVTPPRGVKSLAELRAVAAARFEAIYSASALLWQIHADWRSDRAFVCAALPRGLVDTLPAALAAACPPAGPRLQLGTTLGLALARHGHRLPGQGWCAVRMPEHLALFCSSRGDIGTLREWQSAGRQGGGSPGAETAALALDELVAELQREALRHGAAPPDALALLDLCGPAGPLPPHAGVRIQVLPGSAAAQATAAAQPGTPDGSGPIQEALLAALLGAAAWPRP